MLAVMTPRPLLIAPFLLLIVACSGEIYLRDGVTDGDTFYLAQRALVDDDPAFQSWVGYSLMRSACQLDIGGDNPARASSFDCERTARRHLLESWRERTSLQPELSDPYLDDLVTVEEAGFLDEYVADNFRRRGWSLPNDLELREYRRWLSVQLPDHEAETRLVGSWNYAKNVNTR